MVSMLTFISSLLSTQLLTIGVFEYITALVVLYEFTMMMVITYWDQHKKLMVETINITASSIVTHIEHDENAREEQEFVNRPAITEHLRSQLQAIKSHVELFVLLLIGVLHLCFYCPKLVWQLHIIAIAFMYDWW